MIASSVLSTYRTVVKLQRVEGSSFANLSDAVLFDCIQTTLLSMGTSWASVFIKGPLQLSGQEMMGVGGLESEVYICVCVCV